MVSLVLGARTRDFQRRFVAIQRVKLAQLNASYFAFAGRGQQKEAQRQANAPRNRRQNHLTPEQHYLVILEDSLAGRLLSSFLKSRYRVRFEQIGVNRERKYF